MQRASLTCKSCGCVRSGKQHTTLCADCARKQGICTRCKTRPANQPGTVSCSRCWETKFDENQRNPNRLAGWQIRQLEQDRQSAAEVLAMFAEGQ